METRNDNMTIINDSVPFEPVHPGSVLGEELKARGISQKAFAEMIGIQATHLSALIHGTRNITPAVAAKIETGLPEIPASMWVRLQSSYNIDVQRRSVNNSLLVSGYSFREKTAAVLAEPGGVKAYGSNMISVRITIPEADREMLSSLASRLGWEFE